MADSDQRPVESLWFKHLKDIAEVYEDERKAYSLDLSYLSLVPGSIKLNGVASLVDQQGLTKFDKGGLLQRVKQPDGSSAAAPILVTGRPEADASQEAAAVGTVLQPVCDQLTAMVSQLHMVAHETRSRTRAASGINAHDLQQFRWAAGVSLVQATDQTYDQVKAKAPEADGFPWERGPGARSEPQHELDYMSWWPEKVKRAATSLQLQLPNRLDARSWRSAQHIHPLNFRHKSCPFPLSSKNDLICCLAGSDETAFLGVELKKDLDDQAQREGEVEFYTWDSRATYPFLQVVTDLCRGGVAFWCEGLRLREQGPDSTIIIRRQVFGTMHEVYEFVARALCHIPDYVVQGQPLPNGNWPSQLPEPARFKFFRRAMVSLPEGLADGDDSDPGSEPDDGDGDGGGGGSGDGLDAAEDTDGRSKPRPGPKRQRRAESSQQGRATLGTARSKQLLRYLESLRANADDVANLRDVEDD